MISPSLFRYAVNSARSVAVRQLHRNRFIFGIFSEITLVDPHHSIPFAVVDNLKQRFSVAGVSRLRSETSASIFSAFFAIQKLHGIRAHLAHSRPSNN